MNGTDEYCVVCGQDGPLRHEQKATEFDVRGETLHFQVPVTVCPSCGTTEVEDGLDPAEMAFTEYRKRKELLTPQQIREMRERYRLSQRSFAALLGMSESTINRYEGGGLQNEAHDQAIRACENPVVMRDLLARRGNRLSEWQRKRVEAALAGEPGPRRSTTLRGLRASVPKERSPETGYREFDYRRYVAVVVWLCRQLPLVTATSLNKLLFYVDFLCFKSEAVSLTGVAYRRVEHGPVPAPYGDLQQRMELQGYVDVREVQYHNGRTGMEFRPGPRADELDVRFSPRELKVLEAVASEFKGLTPGQMRDRSHEESAWRDTEDRTLISYAKARELSLPVPE